MIASMGRLGMRFAVWTGAKDLYRPAAVVVTLYSINYSPPNPHYVIVGI